MSIYWVCLTSNILTVCSPSLNIWPLLHAVAPLNNSTFNMLFLCCFYVGVVIRVYFMQRICFKFIVNVIYDKFTIVKKGVWYTLIYTIL